MGLGVGIFLAAVGAVLAFAVTGTVCGVNIHAVGWILLIVGIVGIVLSMIFWSSWAGPGYWTRSRRRTTTSTRAPPALPAPASKPRDHVHFRDGRRKPPRLGRSATATGSSTVNVEPLRPSERDPDAAVHPVHELAADVEAEPGAADAARHAGSRRKNFSKMRVCSEAGMPRP